MVKTIKLGLTGIKVPQNAFGALPIQRVSTDTAVSLLRKAYDGGMRFFDTARAYSDSEEKVGKAFYGYVPREDVYIATKTQAKTPEQLRSDLETSLKLLKTDYIDLYQLHCADRCYNPYDGTGLYEELLKARSEGKVRHIGITTHRIAVAEEIAQSGLYETLQYPFSYLSNDRDERLVHMCEEQKVGFIAMKALAGGLITRADAAFAYIHRFGNVLPIWGIQRENELDQFLKFITAPPRFSKKVAALIQREKEELSGDFCRGCGYCMPCPMGIEINQCARMSLMVRRAPSEAWLNPHWQAEMQKIKTCRECGSCMQKCPYQLNTPELLKKNLADYEDILAGKVRV